jgi:hypothetical protein
MRDDYIIRRCPWPVPPPNPSPDDVAKKAAAEAAQNAGWPFDTGPFTPAGKASPLQTQVGGGHYKDLVIQPVEYNHANNIPYMEGNVIKYVTRWRSKGGIKDLEKAKHYIELLIEMETKHDSK